MRDYGYFLSACPGMVGDLARAIDKIYMTSKPAISLASAFALYSTIKCGRVVSAHGFHPNLYLCLVASSGSGKTRANVILTDILEELNLNHLRLPKPQSEQGLVKSLHASPRGLLMWDEFGPALSDLAKTQTGYKATILPALTEIYTLAGRTYFGPEYASRERAREDIKNVYLNLFASATPSRFYSALTEEFVLDGFLSRIVVFWNKEDEEKVKFRTPEPFQLPANVKEDLQAWAEMPDESRERVDYHGALWRAQAEIFELEKIRERSEVAKVFLSRKFEIFSKLCLVLSPFDGVTIERIQYALELTQFLIGSQIEACSQYLGASPAIKLRNDILEYLKPGEWTSLSEITLRFKNRERKYQREALSTLVEMGAVLERSDWVKGQKSGKKAAMYSRAN